MSRDRKAYNKEYREKNLETIREKDRERYKVERPKRLAAVKRWAENNATKLKAYARTYKYGITPEQYDLLLEQQNNACAVCLAPFTKTPHIDHDHNTDVVRGLLCNPCNTKIGWYESGWIADNQTRISDLLKRGQK